MKNILPFILLFSVINSAYAEPVTPRPLFTSVRTLDTTPLTIELGNYQYKIPANYFFTQPHFNCNHSSALLIALYPKFEGHTEENHKELFGRTSELNRKVMLLLSADSNRKENALSRVKATQKSIFSFHGPFEETPSLVYGLRHYVNEGKKIYRSKQDAFAAGDEEAPTTFINCTVLGSVFNPGCEHLFLVNDLHVKLVYRRAYLPYWKEIEATARALIESWAIQKLDVLKPYCKQTLSEMMKK